MISKTYTPSALCAAVILVACVTMIPFIASAQGELDATIRAEILKDPRSSGIPQAQMDAMVAALSEAAQAQGVTAEDITWRSGEDAAPTANPAVCGFVCSINAIFGFSGDDYTIPLALALCAVFLILVISMMLHRHHKHGIAPTIEAIHTHS